LLFKALKEASHSQNLSLSLSLSKTHTHTHTHAFFHNTIPTIVNKNPLSLEKLK
jgi:hypothetical protein